MLRTLLAASLLPLAACTPMLEMRAGEQADELRQLAQDFCDAYAAGDMTRVANVFAPDLAKAITAAAEAGRPVKLSSRASDTCQPGAVWYIGGSRRVVEIRHPDFSDRMDTWLSGQGRANDITFADNSPSLRETLGLR